MDYQVKQDNKFKYLEEGEGTPLVLLHGLFGTLSNFTDIIDHFKKDFKVVVPLLPLYDLPLLKTSIKGLLKHVEKFIDQRGYEQFHLLGNSLGGHIALMYVLAHPAKVKSVILTGSSGLFENTLGGSFPKRGDYDYIKEKTKLTFYDPKTATKELVDEVYDIVNSRNKAVRIIAIARSAMKHNLRNELQKIKAPVLLIWGNNDTITPPDVGKEFQKQLLNAELKYIDKCGHAPMMERPEEFNELLKNFLAKVEKGQVV